MDGLGCVAVLLLGIAVVGWWLYEDWKLRKGGH
jgi:hypothetical protein